MQFSKSCATPDIPSFHPGKSSFIFTLMVLSLGRGPTSATTAQSPTLASIHGTKLKQAVAPPQVERTSPMTDYKALCARMADELDHYRQLLMDDRRETHALATEARAALAQSETEKAVNWAAYFARQAAAQEKELQDALAQPVPEGPSDKELDLVVIAIQALIPPQPDATTHHLSAVDRGREILRQRLARWGNPQGT
jgi:hypothetical protein